MTVRYFEWVQNRTGVYWAQMEVQDRLQQSMGLAENILREPVSKLPLRELAAVRDSDTIAEAIRAMHDGRVGCVMIVDQDHVPIGKFTERLLTALLLRDAHAIERPVRQHMVEARGCVRLTDPILRVIQLMQRHDLRFVCVVDDTGRAVALTGQRGLMQYICDHFPRQILASRVSVRPYLEERDGA